MSPERLRQLIAGSETLEVEFKGEERAPLSDRDLVETVVCLANRSGEAVGWLFVGVEDDGRVTGARERHGPGLTDIRRVQALIANRTRPSQSCRTEQVALEGRNVLVIEVPASRTPVGTSDGAYLRRAIGGRGGPECLPFHFHEMQSQAGDRGLLDYAALVAPEARWEDLDPLQFARYRRSIRESTGRGDASLVDLPDLEVAKSLGAVDANHAVTAVRVLGLLLFGKTEALQRWVPAHEAAFQVLTERRVEVNDFFRWPLLRVMEEMLARFRARYREEEIMEGMLRIGVPDYSEPAYREGVANALIHRDYTRLGAVHVQWYKDRIEISNPGGFPEGVRLDNLLVTRPRPRNPLLADAFKRAGIVERTARGIDTIFFEQLRNGRPAPSYALSTPTDCRVARRAWSSFELVTQESRADRPLGLDELLLLNRLRSERRLTTTDAATLIQKPETDAGAVLERLVETGLVEALGAGRRRRYQLSAATYRRLGEGVASVRQRGFEPLQQEQRVLQYIRAHGRITRSEASELCRISLYQATRLLIDLTEAEKIVRHGTGKGTWYGPRT